MNQYIDKPKALRDEDTLDLEKLSTFVKTQVSGLVGTPVLEQFSGGASNLTYQLSFDNQAFIIRCPPRGTKAKGAHDMQREYNIQLALKPFYPYIPRMIALCTDVDVLGHDFYVMEKVTGIIPRANLPKGMILSASDTRQLCTNVLDKMVDLHQIKIENTDLQAFGKGDGYAQRQIEGWIGRYEKAKTWNVPHATKIKTWLRANMPAQSRNCLIHNDFRFDNVVLDANDPLKIVGILDWEMATIGDPLMDLGNSLAYWVQADDDFVMRKFRRQPTNMNGMLTRKEVIDYYCKQMGIDVPDFRFYEVYGLFRLAVIVQQIYYRYHLGQTQNRAFRHLYLMANYLIWRCGRVIG
jgi:aminoglycoside phosphotransferase (APT) family kinase protein